MLGRLGGKSQVGQTEVVEWEGTGEGVGWERSGGRGGGGWGEWSGRGHRVGVEEGV